MSDAKDALARAHEESVAAGNLKERVCGWRRSWQTSGTGKAAVSAELARCQVKMATLERENEALRFKGEQVQQRLAADIAALSERSDELRVNELKQREREMYAGRYRG